MTTLPAPRYRQIELSHQNCSRTVAMSKWKIYNFDTGEFTINYANSGGQHRFDRVATTTFLIANSLTFPGFPYQPPDSNRSIRHEIEDGEIQINDPDFVL
ncbi:hypothetical protein NQ317_003380 [Molorchus minor]|uniref:Uncharacterized protein n=1 Tax=Molorchus minor TaxID=1323400 RepID=A0ABQ9K6P2_9CUCU|nr:hypothetical protein NQ317_003380 [Molorchus minor]